MDADAIAAVIGRAFALSDGIAGGLLTYGIHSSAWLLAAWLLSRRPSLAGSPALQHTVWTVATVIPLLTTALQLTGVVDSLAGHVRVGEGIGQRFAAVVVDERSTSGGAPRLRIGAVVGRAGFAPDGGGRVVHRMQLPLLHEGGASPPAPAGATRSFRRLVLAPPPTFFALVAWTGIAALLVLRIVWDRWRLGRAVRASIDASATPAGAALRRLRRSAGVRRQVAIIVSDDVAAPAALSTRTIALPSRLLSELTLREQEGVIAHELAHVTRRDTLWLRLALVVEAVAWFQPLHRLARRRMQLAAEFAADEWAVRLTREPVALARSIARVAEWVSPDPRPQLRPIAVLGADGSPLLQRVRRLTSAPACGAVSVPRRAPASLVIALPMLAVALALALPSVVVGPTPSSRAAARQRDLRVVMVRRDATVPSRASDHLVVIPAQRLD